MNECKVLEMIVVLGAVQEKVKRKLGVLLVSAVVGCAGIQGREARAEGDATITINMQTGEVSPKNPIVNLSTTNSVTIAIQPQPTIEFYPEADVKAAMEADAELTKLSKVLEDADKAYKAAPGDTAKQKALAEATANVAAQKARRSEAYKRIDKKDDDARPDINNKRVRPAYWYSRVGASEVYSYEPGKEFSVTSFVSLRFIRTAKPGSDGCRAADLSLETAFKTYKKGLDDFAAQADKSKEKPKPVSSEDLRAALRKSCRRETVAFVELGQSSWTIYGALERIDFIVEPVEGTALVQGFPRRTVSLQLVEKDWVLDWSGGFAFLGNRDERYRLDPINDDAKNASVTRISDAGLSYKIAAFAHYSPVKAPWVSVTAGLGTDVPVKGLAVFAGASLAVRPAVFTDSAFLTVGASYAARKQIAGDFEGKATVPVGTSTDSLVAEKYGVGFFVGMSFGFFGGADKFKAVYPGGGSGSGSETVTKK